MKNIKTNYRSENLKKQRGEGIIALLVFFAVVAVFIVWIVSKGVVAQRSAATVTESGNIDTLAAQIDAARGATGGYGPAGTDLAAMLVNANQVPGNITTSGTAIYNQWNGAYAITSNFLTYTFSDAQVPRNICPKTVLNEATTQRWATITVNGTAIAQSTISGSAATDACNADQNTIVLTSNN